MPRLDLAAAALACLLAAAPTAAAEAPRLPVLVPLTGFLALEGTSQRNGAVLALVSNFGRTARAVDPPQGDLLFESRAGAGVEVRAGRLAGPATVAFLETAAGGSG